MLTDTDSLIPMIEAEAAALGFDLVRVKYAGPAGEKILQVMAERPDTRQLTIDDCAALSHRISDRLDELDPIEEPYRLEVSSPGIDRPLTREKDYQDWAGYEARINLIGKVGGRKQLNGCIKGVENAIITLEDRKSGLVEIAFDNVHSAKLLLTDALIRATAPLDVSGAEDVEEDFESEAEG